MNMLLKNSVANRSFIFLTHIKIYTKVLLLIINFLQHILCIHILYLFYNITFNVIPVRRCQN